MEVKYFDTCRDFAVFAQYIEHPMFLDAIRFWASIGNGTSGHARENFVYDPIEPLNTNFNKRIKTELFFDERDREISNTITSLARRASPRESIWWTAYMDCGDSNNILMSTLYCLAFGRNFTNIYSLRIHDDRTRHAVIIDTYVRPETQLKITGAPDGPVIYDLIEPSLPLGAQYGFSDVYVDHCVPLVTVFEQHYVNTIVRPEFEKFKTFMLANSK